MYINTYFHIHIAIEYADTSMCENDCEIRFSSRQSVLHGVSVRKVYFTWQSNFQTVHNVCWLQLGLRIVLKMCFTLHSSLWTVDELCCTIESSDTGWRRVKGCLIFMGHFPQSSPQISGSLTERDLQLKASYASSPPCSNQRVRHIAIES